MTWRDEPLVVDPKAAIYQRAMRRLADFMIWNERYGVITVYGAKWRAIQYMGLPFVVYFFLLYVGQVENAFRLYGLIVFTAYVFGLFFVRTRVKFLNGEWQQHKIVEMHKVTHDTIRVKCELNNPSQVFGMPVPQHVFLGVKFSDIPEPDVVDEWNGNPVDYFVESKQQQQELFVRKYSPISIEEEEGSVTYIIKVYQRCEEFPDGGAFGRTLEKYEVGDMLAVKGPIGWCRYHNGLGFQYKQNPVDWTIRNLVIIAGGSGIAPIYQLVRTICLDPMAMNPIRMGLVYGNIDDANILMKGEIDELGKYYADKFTVHYTVDKLKEIKTCDWPGSIGYINQKMIEQNTPWIKEEFNKTLLYFCGPPAMKDSVKAICEELGYNGQTWGL